MDRALIVAFVIMNGMNIDGHSDLVKLEDLRPIVPIGINELERYNGISR
jgi:hypothetical protein